MTSTAVAGAAESERPKPMRMRHLLRAIRQGKQLPERKVHRIRIPVLCASLVFSLADNLKHKKPAETLEWLFKNSEEAVRGVEDGTHHPISKSSNNTALLGFLSKEGRGQQQKKKVMSKDGRNLAENGRTPRIRLPEHSAQKLYALTKKLGMKTNGQTVKWLCEHCQPAIAAIVSNNNNNNTVWQSISENKDAQLSDNASNHLSEVGSSEEASSRVNAIQCTIQPTSSNNQLGFSDNDVQSPSSRVSSTDFSYLTDFEINDFDMAGFMDIVSELGLTADDISQQGYPEPLASNSFHYAGPCNSTGCSQYTMQQLPLHPNYCSEHSSFHYPWSSVNHSFPSNYIQWFNCTQHQMHPLNISGHHSVPCDNNEKTSQCVQHMQTIANGFGDPFALPNYNGLPQFTQQQAQSTINGYLQSIEQKPKVTHMEALQGGNQFQSIGGLKQADISTTLQRLNSEKPTMVEIMSEETKMKSSDGGKFLIPYTGGQRSCNQGVNPNLYWNLT